MQLQRTGLDSTTDVTRTLHFSTPTDQQRHAFMRVLQGHIAVDSAVFPNGTTVCRVHYQHMGEEVLVAGWTWCVT